MSIFNFLDPSAGRLLTAVFYISLEAGAFSMLLRITQHWIPPTRNNRAVGLFIGLIGGLIASRYYALTYSHIVCSDPEHLITVVVLGTLANLCLASFIYRTDK